MPRFIHRRAIVFIVLVCQILALGVVHVPMAKAALATPAAAASKHCHDNGPTTSNHHDGASHAGVTHATSGTGDPASDLGHHCKSGFCACVCLSAPAALPETSVSAAPTTSHPPLLVTESVRSAPERAAVFFRPPI